MKTAPEILFWAKVNKNDPDGHWLWTAAKNAHGYGVFMTRQGVFGQPAGSYLAHRLSYIAANGSIPEGLSLDHLCGTPPCVNPSHLEAVPHRINMERTRKKFCVRGHPWAEEDTYQRPDRPHSRECKACKRIRDRGYRAKKRAGR